MSKKRVSYQNLLKQAISEFDTSKTVDVKGPMLDPILKWDGDGELPIYKDAASILERYYFNEDSDKGVEVTQDGTEKQTDSEEHIEGTGTQQAGTSDETTIQGSKEEAGREIAKEEETQLENAVLEKLIAEMEAEDDDDDDDDNDDDDNDDDDDDDDDDDNDDDLGESTMNFTGAGVAPGMDAEDEKEATGPMQDAQGAGTEQAGTGIAAGEVPDRNDHADKFVKPKNFNEADESNEEVPGQKDGDKEPEGVDVEIDVDDELKEASAVPGGPSPRKTGSDWEEDKYYEEAFEIFKEAIENDE